jgi:hypothetical protein
MSQLYTVRTHAGIIYSIEADSYTQACQRASADEIGKRLAEMIQAAVAHVESIEQHRGPSRLAHGPVFGSEFFRD